ncbi:hypothetical protein CYMTET_31189 [Cymbomonas tetramitiformis]|uniref:FAD dependent oxidoreductase domain-containing protein n=1 Tax=Cymbomonas tetramitiformis TaxID=36881 RepID=A0AAE0KTE7_9CHLO|nr:hypothetical protein CYMTET_31189 [Cymbomonas tetramitiformis]
MSTATKVHGSKGVICGGEWIDIEDCGEWSKGCPSGPPATTRQATTSAAKADGSYDVVIIGAGCIGSAVARELSKTNNSVLVIEKADDVTQGATKGNSGIVHSGFDDTPGSNRAKFCWKGNQMFEQLDRELHFGYLKNGSLVVARNAEDEKTLQEPPQPVHVTGGGALTAHFTLRAQESLQPVHVTGGDALTAHLTLRAQEPPQAVHVTGGGALTAHLTLRAQEPPQPVQVTGGGALTAHLTLRAQESPQPVHVTGGGALTAHLTLSAGVATACPRLGGGALCSAAQESLQPVHVTGGGALTAHLTLRAQEPPQAVHVTGGGALTAHFTLRAQEPPQPVHVTGGDALTAHLTLRAQEPPQAVHVTGGGALTAHLTLRAQEPPQPVHVTGGGALTAHLTLRAQESPQPVHVTGGGALTAHLTLRAQESPPQPVHVTGGGALTAHLTLRAQEPPQPVHVTGGGALTAHLTLRAQESPQPVHVTGGAHLTLRAQESPQPVHVTGGGALTAHLTLRARESPQPVHVTGGGALTAHLSLRAQESPQPVHVTGGVVCRECHVFGELLGYCELSVFPDTPLVCVESARLFRECKSFGKAPVRLKGLACLECASALGWSRSVQSVPVRSDGAGARRVRQCARMEPERAECASALGWSRSAQSVPVRSDGAGARRELLERGETNGVKDLRIIGKEELLSMEPHLNQEATAALWSPHAGTVTPYEYTIAVAENAADNGVEIQVNKQVTGIDKVEGGGFLVHAKPSNWDPNAKNWTPESSAPSSAPSTSASQAILGPVLCSLGPGCAIAAALGLMPVAALPVVLVLLAAAWYFLVFAATKAEAEVHIRTRYVVNCAGLFSDKIAEMVGDKSFYVKPRLGEYLLLHKDQGHLAGATLFPCPGKMGKGVLVQTTLWGNLILGPTARDLSDPETAKASKQDIIMEVLTKCRELVPSFDVGQVIHSFAGARAKTSRGDWIIEECATAKDFFHAAGIDSPGLAASPAIAIEVTKMLHKAGLSTSPNPGFNPHRRPIITPKDGWKGLKVGHQDPAKNVVCKCEKVTEAEVVDAIHRSLTCNTTQAIRKRTRAGMGHCQADPDNLTPSCEERVAQIIARETKIKQDKVGRRPWPATSLLPQRWLGDDERQKFRSLIKA